MTSNEHKHENPGDPYKVREVVAVFDSAEELEDAVEKLQESGVARPDVSLLATDKAIMDKLGRHFRKVSELEDNPLTPQAAFVSSADIAEEEAVLVGVPLYIGAVAGTLAVVASGGALGFILAAAAAGGAGGAAIGALAARALGKQHAKNLEEQLKRGGLLLWVRVRDNTRQDDIEAILSGAGGRHVHAHDLERMWGEKDIPLHDFNPDPLLGKEQ
ncbi:MAG TPA: hypothetical protein ENH05_08045 [Rhizobiales bacterium]|nr:hypothetical protein BMS3Bbin10_02287 [bacterium BMS3Bbin10]HDO52672.1 hypothetical protein [Hyphomicrobiales bacterium]